MHKKQASSQAAWALLTGGVSEARTEVHRLRHLTNRAQKVIDNYPPERREKIYQVAGDVIVGVPERLAKIEQTLDKVSYALSCMGQDFLKSRLPLDDRTEVDEAVKHTNHAFPGGRKKSSLTVAQRYLEAKGLTSDGE